MNHTPTQADILHENIEATALLKQHGIAFTPSWRKRRDAEAAKQTAPAQQAAPPAASQDTKAAAVATLQAQYQTAFGFPAPPLPAATGNPSVDDPALAGWMLGVRGSIEGKVNPKPAPAAPAPSPTTSQGKPEAKVNLTSLCLAARGCRTEAELREKITHAPGGKLAAVAAAILFAVFMALPSMGQQAIGAYPVALTNSVTATSTNALSVVQVVDTEDFIGLQLSGTPLSTTTETLTLRIAQTSDGITYETTPSLSATLTFSGTNTASSFKALNVQAARDIRIVSVENPGAVGITNLSATWSIRSPKRAVIGANGYSSDTE